MREKGDASCKVVHTVSFILKIHKIWIAIFSTSIEEKWSGQCVARHYYKICIFHKNVLIFRQFSGQLTETCYLNISSNEEIFVKKQDSIIIYILYIYIIYIYIPRNILGDIPLIARGEGLKDIHCSKEYPFVIVIFLLL